MSQADVDVHAVEQATQEIIKQANADGTIECVKSVHLSGVLGCD